MLIPARFTKRQCQNRTGGLNFRVPETINKLQPDRTVYLRGFNTFAAAASIHSASPAGFTVSGTFRDPADFAVAVLYDVDNYYEHPLIKYLPDFSLAGLALNGSQEDTIFKQILPYRKMTDMPFKGSARSLDMLQQRIEAGRADQTDE